MAIRLRENEDIPRCDINTRNAHKILDNTAIKARFRIELIENQCLRNVHGVREEKNEQFNF